jgi:hypothetical protein
MLWRVPTRAVSYLLGPEDGTLSVRTKRTGAAAKAGHNLLIDVTSWEATIELGAETTIALDADGASLRVREGSGGMQALGDEDKDSIRQTIDDEVLERRPISFRSTLVEPAGGAPGLSVHGELTLLGVTRPIAFDVDVTGDGGLSAVAVVRQTEWGMKPYSGLFGALKVVDEVEVAIDARLPGPQSL